MVLHSQQTSVQRRLSTPSATPSPESSPSRHSSISGSPSRHGYSHSVSSFPRSPRSPFLRRPSVPTISEEATNDEMSALLQADHDKLFDINKRIKATLTDLLNCESVKHDGRMRGWVQSRLMDAQHVLNDQRRNRVND